MRVAVSARLPGNLTSVSYYSQFAGDSQDRVPKTYQYPYLLIHCYAECRTSPFSPDVLTT